MKRILILLVASSSLALALSFMAAYDPGYVRLSFGHWLIESNLIVFSIALIFLVLGLVWLLGLKRRVLNSGKSISNWLGQSSTTRATAKTEKGLVALLEGNWGTASRLLTRSANNAHKPMINYLAAAHASNELGQTKEAELMLKKAYESTNDSDFAVGIAQAQIQLQQEQYEPCLATLLRLHKQQAHHPFVLKLLKTVYLKLEDWHNLIKLIPDLQKSAKISSSRIQSLEKLAWNKLFVQKTDELINRSQDDKAPDILASLWQSVPTHLQFDVQVVVTYGEQLVRLGHEHECETLVRKVLEKHWDDTLVELYGKVAASNISEQLIHAEQWLKRRPNDAALLLALGRLSLRNHLWGKAYEYFEASLKLGESKACLAELCRLNVHLNPDHYGQRGVLESLLTSLELPDLPMP